MKVRKIAIDSIEHLNKKKEYEKKRWRGRIEWIIEYQYNMILNRGVRKMSVLFFFLKSKATIFKHKR